jgi:hypothetical protein
MGYYTTLSDPQLRYEICRWEAAYWRITGVQYLPGTFRYWRAPAWDYDSRVANVFYRYHGAFSYPGSRYHSHSGAHLASRDAFPWLNPFGWGATGLARCVLKWVKDKAPKTNPLVIGWHDEPGTAPLTPDAMRWFLAEAGQYGVTVADYDPALPTPQTGEPANIPKGWMFRCMVLGF